MTNIVYSKQPQANIHLAKGDSAQKPISLEYLAEGNANIIYAFKPTAEDAVPQNLHRKLLRLRKEKHFIEPTELQYQIYRRHLVPLFHPDNIVEQTLISLDKVLAASLNEDLKELEKSGSRKELRRGDRLATDEYGLLITGMTAQPGEFLFEIKPKWLQQSPDAPSGSVRCRTCALRLQRNNAEASGVVVPKSGGFCPLSLVDADIEERRRAFESIVRSQARTISEQAVEAASDFLAEKGYRVLLDLREHQARFDKKGLLSLDTEEVSDDYSKAMTLRDCVLFVRGSLDAFPDTAEVRLADLDFKHAHPDKVQKWKSTERVLIDQGWYTDAGADNGPERPICLLTRRSL